MTENCLIFPRLYVDRKYGDGDEVLDRSIKKLELDHKKLVFKNGHSGSVTFTVRSAAPRGSADSIVLKNSS